MAKQVQFRRGTTAQHSIFTGAAGEMTIDTTKNTVVVHDGTTVGGHTVEFSFDVVDDTSPQLGGDFDVNDFDIVGKPAADATSNGNDVTILASDGGATSGTGGKVIITSGTGGGGTRPGGTITINGGNATYTGSVNIEAGNATAINSNANNLTLKGGAANGTGTAGDVYVSGGSTGSGSAGNLFLRAGGGTLAGTTSGVINVQVTGTTAHNTAPEMKFFGNDINGNSIGIRAPLTPTADRTWTLPGDDPSVVAGDYLTTDASGVLSFVSPPITPVNNLLINGSFDIWQRSTSDTYSGSSWRYGSADRWKYFTADSTGSATITRNALPKEDEADYYLSYSQTVATTTSSPFLAQSIENVKTANGQKIQVTLGAIGNMVGSIRVVFRQSFGSGGSSAVLSNEETFTINTGAWTTPTMEFDIPSIAGKTIGTGSSLDMLIGFPPSITGYINLRRISAVISDIPGNGAIKRHIGEELELCQRYYQFAYSSGTAEITTTNNGYFNLPFVTEMRATPTIGSRSIFQADSNISSISIGLASKSNATLNVSPTSSGIAFFHSFWPCDAEL